MQARTDLPAATLDTPLSARSVEAMFSRVRREFGLPARRVVGQHDGAASERAERRRVLETAGFPFASDIDYAAI